MYKCAPRSQLETCETLQNRAHARATGNCPCCSRQCVPDFTRMKTHSLTHVSNSGQCQCCVCNVLRLSTCMCVYIYIYIHHLALPRLVSPRLAYCWGNQKCAKNQFLGIFFRRGCRPEPRFLI